MKFNKSFFILTVLINLSLTVSALPKFQPLPRHQSLKTFDPHRKDFVCKYEKDGVPAIDEEAEDWNRQALFLTRHEIWPNQKDWKTAEQLWTDAAKRNHWKALMNLASMYESTRGEGAFMVRADPYKSVEIAENAMLLGIAAGFEKMGYYHYRGMGGLVQDASRAWAFWQIAADMGNPQ